MLFQTVLVVRPLAQVARMVMHGGLGPVLLVALIELTQKLCAVSRVLFRLKRLVQTAECLSVIFQINLHAADVNVSDAAVLQRLHGGNRLCFGFVITPFAVGMYRPRPCNATPGFGVPAPALNRRYGLQKVWFDVVFFFGLVCGNLAQFINFGFRSCRLGGFLFFCQIKA